MTQDLSQGETEEDFLIKQYKKYKKQKKRTCSRTIIDFIDQSILCNRKKLDSKVEVKYSYINF